MMNYDAWKTEEPQEDFTGHGPDCPCGDCDAIRERMDREDTVPPPREVSDEEHEEILRKIYGDRKGKEA